MKLVNYSGNTLSENIFEEFCTWNSIPFTRVERLVVPTPDYIIDLCHQKVMVEIKQLDKSDDDKLFMKKIRNAHIASRWESTDKRIRNAIDTSRKQFRTYKNNKVPKLLVIFDNTSLEVINPDDVRTAMYGDETVSLLVNETDIQSPPIVKKVGFGRNKKLSPEVNTTFSALATLSKFGDGTLFLNIYHNIFAKNPIDPSWFRSYAVAQFSLSENIPMRLQDWKVI